jgi:hypothetical protein
VWLARTFHPTAAKMIYRSPPPDCKE